MNQPRCQRLESDVLGEAARLRVHHACMHAAELPRIQQKPDSQPDPSAPEFPSRMVRTHHRCRSCHSAGRVREKITQLFTCSCFGIALSHTLIKLMSEQRHPTKSVGVVTRGSEQDMRRPPGAGTVRAAQQNATASPLTRTATTSHKFSALPTKPCVTIPFRRSMLNMRQPGSSDRLPPPSTESCSTPMSASARVPTRTCCAHTCQG